MTWYTRLIVVQGNARIEGLTTDLGVTGSNYNVALMLFFLGYVLFEVISVSTSSLQLAKKHVCRCRHNGLSSSSTPKSGW